jgi:hypothetical protein
MTGSLAVSSGTLNTNNNPTLVSNAGSAVIAPVASVVVLQGKVTVEPYIAQAKSAFRFLTPGVALMTSLTTGKRAPTYGLWDWCEWI